MRTYALIGFLVALVIVAILVYKAGILYTRGSEGSQVVTSPIERANRTQCTAQIRKLQMAIQHYFSENGRYPANLVDLGDISSAELNCPVTGDAYIYDPERGMVMCPQHK